MEDNFRGISSTTPSVDDLLQSGHEYGTEDETTSKLYDDAAGFLIDTREAVAKDFDDDDILDLAGGAQDALERHRSTLPRYHEPIADSFSDPTPEPEPELEPEPEPESSVPDPEPVTAPHKLVSGLGDISGKLSKEEDAPPKEEKTAIVIPKSRAKSGLLVDLLYWRDTQRSGVVFGASLFLLLSLSVCSIVSVCAYIALALLSVTISFRIYKGILQAVQKSEEGHPFKMYLENDVSVPTDLVHKYSELGLRHVNTGIKELRRLFLVEDLVDSLKFAALLWILTYIGAFFNGLTLCIMGLVGVFSWPVIYEKHQVQIDHYYGMVSSQVKDFVGKIQAKVPGLKPKSE
ncbi:reticulon-4a isoform X1 [Alosa sapidissima]|uniref:reticulon-4a isoform X1 n=1 Tax=Alosa sapidissima TaxID=34773 RepID=UPI001C091B3D|nr:reticulon-4a isoform X1 [Alosa sapidissima]XP_041959255.1 reticulon-4a isoform X1 [Alosa sapidissima]